ncbi:MAG: hypothetical protein R3E12_01595 [Candidatus Eisenbacteria bacterium]
MVSTSSRMVPQKRIVSTTVPSQPTAAALPLRRSLITTGLAFMIAVAGCSSKTEEAKRSGDAKDLVTLATQIPLYPGARAEDAMGSDLYGDTKDAHMKGMAVWFTTEGTFDDSHPGMTSDRRGPEGGAG